MDFINEAEEWLKPFGYTIHSYSADRTSAIFSNYERYSPSIRCFLNENNEKRCNISDCRSYKLFLSLQTPDIAFKHKDLSQYIEVFIHYAKMAQHNPPW